MNEAQTSVRLYTPLVLSVYDLYVLQVSSRVAWQFPAYRILELYNRHISAQHLEVGVGTGYFLDKAHYPVARPKLTLVDLNANTLRATRRRIERFVPNCIVANALDALPIREEFHSIGMNYVLHTMPGCVRDKAIVLRYLRKHLCEGGVLFGTTLLGNGVVLNPLARLLMRVYNHMKWFSNALDTRTDLESGLQEHFTRYDLQVFGPTAVFEAWA